MRIVESIQFEFIFLKTVTETFVSLSLAGIKWLIHIDL